jgi:uncharacterized protein (TIGR03435 family)
MTRTLLLTPVLALMVSHGHCQPAANDPVFEVASITPCEPGTPAPAWEHNGMVQFILPGGRFTARSTTVKFLIEWAYGILPSQHSAGPPWMSEERYDILAKATGNATDDEIKRMVQAMLAERFRLKLHRESREAPALVLTLGKTPPKLFPPKEDEKYSLKIVPQKGEDQKVLSFHIAATRFSFAQLNRVFARQIDRVIVNETGLEGDFDFSLDLTPDENRPNPLDASLLISAMRDQLGLTVRAQKSMVDYWAIEGAERVMSGN